MITIIIAINTIIKLMRINSNKKSINTIIFIKQKTIIIAINTLIISIQYNNNNDKSDKHNDNLKQ